MSNLAHKLDPTQLVQEAGTVTCAVPDRLMVRTDSGQYRAKRAASCLLKPEQGDEVLVVTMPRGRCYVLAVLERDEGAAAELTASGDLSIRLPRGRLTMASPKGIGLLSEGEIDMATRSFKLNAVDGSVALQKLSYLGCYLQSELERVKAFASSIDTVAERISQRVKRCYRTVEQYDHVRAERLDYKAKRTMSLHGQNAIMTAQQLVKVDGEQIHVG